MKIYTNLNINDSFKRTVTLGDFDGVHKGHMALINKVKSISKKEKTLSSIITFSHNSKIDFRKNFRYIYTNEEKIELLKKTGVDEIFVLDFEKDIKNKTAMHFIYNLLNNKLNVQNIVLGDDAKLGSDLLNIKEIKKIIDRNNEITTKINEIISIYIINEITVENNRVSSSLIRKMIKDGVVGEDLKKYLGRYYIIRGKVKHGNSIGGEKLGFPTANLDIDKNLIFPKYGVYSAISYIGEEKYKAGVNLGFNPTVNNKYFSLEAFLLNFNGDLYGKEISILLKDYIRSEIKFKNLNELKKQITKDVDFIEQNLKI